MKCTFNLLTVAAILVFSSCFLSCSKEGLSVNDSSGKGGSLAKFTIAGDYLYAIDNYYLYTYDLTNPANPKKLSEVSVAFDIETIYPYKNFLFMGSRTGFYIYSIANPADPQKVGMATHVRSCDPVVANDSVAFVTLKGSNPCGPAVSGLYIHDIKQVTSPALVKVIELPDPVGLGLQGNILYVCCGNAGLKVFDVKNPKSPALLSTKADGVYQDVIPYNGTLICFTLNGIILYDISNPASPVMIKEVIN